MNIGLIDVDGHSGFPNLALMRLSAWHKGRGDHVEWWNGFCRYDRVYMSKVFTFTPDVDTVIDAGEVIRGGTGYKDYGSLPEEIENTAPDYSIYPAVNYAVGFLTRGCCRRCPWCIVPVKEGQIRPAAAWEEVKRPDSNRIIFMDNNVLASPHGLQQIKAMEGQKVWVDFNQGLDARLVTPETAALLACDTTEMLPVIEQAVAYMKEAGIAKSRFWAYLLVQDVEDAKDRAVALKRMGVEPFAQPYRDYDGGEPTQLQKQFAHWVNKKSVFHSCTWEEFKK